VINVKVAIPFMETKTKDQALDACKAWVGMEPSPAKKANKPPERHAAKSLSRDYCPAWQLAAHALTCALAHTDDKTLPVMLEGIVKKLEKVHSDGSISSTDAEEKGVAGGESREQLPWGGLPDMVTSVLGLIKKNHLLRTRTDQFEKKVQEKLADVLTRLSSAYTQVRGGGGTEAFANHGDSSPGEAPSAVQFIINNREIVAEFATKLRLLHKDVKSRRHHVLDLRDRFLNMPQLRTAEASCLLDELVETLRTAIIGSGMWPPPRK